MRGGRMKRADKRETYLTFGKERERAATREGASNHARRTAEIKPPPATTLRRRRAAETRNTETKPTPPKAQEQEGGHKPATGSSPNGREGRKAPRGAQTRATGPRRGGAKQPGPTPESNYTTTGRGSAARSKAARPRWVMIEISRVARANTAERTGSSAGAC